MHGDDTKADVGMAAFRLEAQAEWSAMALANPEEYQLNMLTK